MNPEQILVRAFLAGAADLERNAGLLDRINVFPVADGDTGGNMSHTLKAVTGRLEALADEDLDELKEAVGQALIRGARGNSGVIFSQYLAAFLEALLGYQKISPASFVAAACAGRDAAYAAVAKPVEGTILTAISDFADILAGFKTFDTRQAHVEMESQLARSVERTPALLPRLKNAGVVDSGALGFYIFASGLALALPACSSPKENLGRIEDRLQGRDTARLEGLTRPLNPAFLASEASENRDHRYCVNVLVRLAQPRGADLRERLGKLGSSVDIAATGTLAKLHVHSDNPEAVRSAALEAGELLSFEFEDMDAISRSEAAGAEEAMEHVRFRVVADSSMSLPPAIRTELGISRIENYVGASGRMVRDCDVDLEEMMEGLREGRVYKTAQTSPGEVEDFLAKALQKSDRLVYVAVGNAYTGTQALVRKILETHPERHRIEVLDSRAASGQMGLICLAAARLAAVTTDFDYLINYIKYQILNCREYLVIDDLKYLSRAGRIGKIKAAFAGALSVKPIVGHGESGAITYGKTRGREEAFEEISKRIASHPGQGDLLVMLEHTDNRSWLEEVRERLKTALPEETEFIVCPLSSTSAAHMGPGTWGVAVTRIRRDDE